MPANISQDHDARASQYEDWQQAIADFQSSASFASIRLIGPFIINSSLGGDRLLLDVCGVDDRRLRLFIFSLIPCSRLMKDYQLLVKGREQAIQDGRQQWI